MRHLKIRLFALVLVVACAALVYYNWQQLTNEGRYSMKLATFSPVGIVGGIFLLLFPSKVGKPASADEKIVVLLVLVVGMAIGLLNWYLMDPGFFGK